MQGLTDKVVLVAGAATGLGADSARRLAREGCKVVVGDLDLEGAEHAAAAIADAAYSATKAGINALARHIASGWGKDGIRANAITPGLILTDKIKQGADPKMLQGMLSGTRSPRLGNAADISSMVAYLMSDDGEWINGQVVNVDGGTVLR